MAFLDQTPVRPSCVISALPKRYRDSLARNLGHSVAISTCPVDQLETAVRMRGATLVIVGVSRDSLTVAERLSHAPHDLKVFLAHYKDTYQSDTPLNGFAGAFDLRAGPERLADLVRRSISLPSKRPESSAQIWPQRRFEMLPRFIEMQKRLPCRQGVLDLILRNFVDLVSADEGMLLVPKGVGFERWEIASSIGEDTPLPGKQIRLEKSCLKRLLDNQIYKSSEGIRVFCPEVASSLSDYAMAVPLTLNGQLSACILSNRSDRLEALAEYMEGALFLFQQLAKRNIKEERESLLARARESACSPWVLVDIHGRVIHREGKESTWLTNNESIVQDARLKDLLARSFDGKSGSAQIRGRKVSCDFLEVKQRRYGLLRLERPETVLQASSSTLRELDLILLLLTDQTGNSSVESDLIEEILAAAKSQPGSKKAVQIEKLAALGIEMEANSEKLPIELSITFAVILVVARKTIGKNLLWRYLQSETNWFLTVEIPETKLPDENCHWAQHPLIQLAIWAVDLGDIDMKCTAFGFQLRLGVLPCINLFPQLVGVELAALSSFTI